MNTIIQILSLILGALFLVMAFRLSRKTEHSFTPAVIIISAIFFFCALFPVKGLLQKLGLEQIACWAVALTFLIAAFRFLQKEKISLAFSIFFLAAIFFFCSLSGVQSLLKTGMLSTVTNTLIKYGDKLDDFQLAVTKMKGGLSDQQTQIEKQQTEIEAQQAIIRESQLEVATQQKIVTNQNERIMSLQNVLALAQSNVDKLTAQMIEQQTRLDSHQTELDKQQSRIRKAQADVAEQQKDLTNQFVQISRTQSELAIAQTNLDSQQKKIEGVESLIGGLYSRTVAETIAATDTSRITTQRLGWNATRVFIKLNNAPVLNSLQGVEQAHVGPIRALTGIIFGSPYSSQMPLVGIMATNNIAFLYFGGAFGAVPKNAVFIIHYVKDQQNTNLVQKVEVKGSDVFLDGKRFVHPPQVEAPRPAVSPSKS